MPFLQSLILLKSERTAGCKVQSDAIPTIALMTSRASSCGTTLKTMTVETKVKATIIT